MVRENAALTMSAPFAPSRTIPARTCFDKLTKRCLLHLSLLENAAASLGSESANIDKERDYSTLVEQAWLQRSMRNIVHDRDEAVEYRLGGFEVTRAE